MNQTTNAATAAASPDYALTDQGLEALRADLRRLREKRDGLADPAGEDDLVLAARIASLEQIVERAWVIDPLSLRPDVVEIGSNVTIEDLDTGLEESYRVVGKYEPLRPGELSAASAIGVALLGRRRDEVVDAELPNGRTRRLRIAATAPTASE